MNELVCSTYKLIQIHIPKTGGSSIQRFIYGLPRIKAPHRKSLQILENISRYKDYFTFAVVRNPLDRIISTYFYYTTRGGNRTGKDKKIGREFRKRGLKAVIMDLENLHRYIPFYEEQLSRVFLPQHYYTHKNNRFVLNKIFYYERLFEC
ncbi:MAG TPA: sulfotransferase family 2 domain-containing protein, partial [Spirochaetota bacterium]|nr:sulfotransferase family 2 domain-containing protein [Spirochaetota bacterium]